MPIERRRVPESAENTLSPEQYWLLGIIEAGATIGSTNTIKNGRETNKLFLNVSEADVGIMMKLASNFGGTYFQKGGTHLWSAGSDLNITEILGPLAPYAVTRKHTIEAMLYGQEAASHYSDAGSQGNNDYSHQINQPAFVAGVMDTRSSVYRTRDGSPTVETISVNGDLLQSLAQKYGGQVMINVAEGTSASIGGIDFVTGRDSFRWIIPARKTREMLGDIENHLAKPPFFGWRHTDQEWNLMIRDAKIEDQVRSEVKAAEENDDVVFSTNPQLAMLFGTDKSAVSRALNKLPQDIRDARIWYLRSRAHSTLQEDQIKRIVDEVSSEMRAFQSGTGQRIKFNGEYAEKYQISKDTFLRNILSRLDPEIKEHRTKILLSQARKK